MLLKERKPGEPRTESGCNELERSMTIGDKGPIVLDAADGRRAMLSQSHKSVQRERMRQRVESLGKRPWVFSAELHKSALEGVQAELLYIDQCDGAKQT